MSGLIAHLRYVSSGYTTPCPAQLGSSPTTTESSSPTRPAGPSHRRSPSLAFSEASSAQHAGSQTSAATAEHAQDKMRSAVLRSKAGSMAGLDFDARLAVGYLCILGAEGWSQLQGLIEEASSPQQAQTALTIGMQAAALQVRLLLGCSPKILM